MRAAQLDFGINSGSRGLTTLRTEETSLGHRVRNRVARGRGFFERTEGRGAPNVGPESARPGRRAPRPHRAARRRSSVRPARQADAAKLPARVGGKEVAI